ncbi:hypothetical protein Ciccas_007569 [Cichlidogyrus casuarinus]|uniref:Uncharacterized protein n=1 Tax=Cichlidogyrus casuarinus TaxID=1844966 RepID=A0ABD2Q2I4_9PLAT
MQGRAAIEDWQDCYQASSLHPEFGLHLLLCYFLHDERYGFIAQTATRLKDLFIILLADFLTVNRDSFFARQGQGSCDSLTSTSSLLTGAQSSLFEELCRLLSSVHSQCGHCHQLTAAYLVMITIRAVLYDMCAQSEDDAPSKAKCSGDVGQKAKSRRPDIPLADLMKVMQKWHLNCSRMETILCCYAMLLHRPQLTDEADSAPAGIPMLQTSIISQRGVPNQRIFEQIFRESLSLQSVSTQGRKLLADMFSRWLLFWRLSPQQVVALYHEMCLRNGDQTKEQCTFSAQTIGE